MSELVVNCPRCGARKITAIILAAYFTEIRHDWLTCHDAFSVCKNCHQTTVFLLELTDYNYKDIHVKTGIAKIPDSVNNYFKVAGYRSLKDNVSVRAPEHVPANIVTAFDEGAVCLSVNCFNAAGTMFRLCVDHATNALLPPTDVDGLNKQIRRSLGLRVQWLLATNRLPKDLQELSKCIKEDGNDGAHAGTLTKPDVEDLLDFTVLLLERLYTEPMRLQLAQDRRNKRRGNP